MKTDKIIKVIQEVHEQFKARGNFGHSGRPGKVGGSMPGKGALSGAVDVGKVPSAKRAGEAVFDALQSMNLTNSHLRSPVIHSVGDNGKAVVRFSVSTFDQPGDVVKQLQAKLPNFRLSGDYARKPKYEAATVASYNGMYDITAQEVE